MRCGPTWASRRERQWAEQAVARTTPALLGRFSLVRLLAHEHLTATAPAEAAHQAAWYAKTTPAFSDALAVVRRRWWTATIFPPSPGAQNLVKVPRACLDHLTDLLCYAA